MNHSASNDMPRAIMRVVLAAFYAAAGLAHLWVPDKLLAITPSWVPYATQVILITGICEIAGAIALVTRPLRWWAGVAFALYALCVWPANIKHALDGVNLPPIPDS
ncbi:DoxX family protein, partial [Streptococcus suis]